MNRPARAFFILLALGALSVAPAQYLEATVPIGAAADYAMWSAVGNKVYVPSVVAEVCVVNVIDGASNATVASVAVPDHPGLPALNSVEGKVYCASGERNKLNVICAYGDTLIRQVRVTGYPSRVEYDARENKFYVIATDDELVHAFDAHSDTTVARIHALYALGMLYQAQTARLFVSVSSGDDTLMVLDCATDTVTALHHLTTSASGHLCTGLNGMVYLPCRYQVAVFSPDGEHQLASIPTPSRNTTFSVYAPSEAKLYLLHPDAGILVVDCIRAIVVDTIALGASAPYVRDAVCDTLRGRLYVLSPWEVLVFDTRTDSLVASVALPPSAHGNSLAWNPTNRRMYVPAGSSLHIIRDTTSGVEEAQPRPFSEPAAPTVVRGVLRLPAPVSGTLLDASGRAVLALRPGPNDVSRLAPGVYFVHSPIDNRHSTISKVVLTR